MNKKGTKGVIWLTVIVFVIVIVYYSFTPAFEKVRAPFRTLLNSTDDFDSETISNNLQSADRVDNAWKLWPLAAVFSGTLAYLYVISKKRDDYYG